MANLVQCNDGTTDLICDMGCSEEMLAKIPCENQGGVKTYSGGVPSGGGRLIPEDAVNEYNSRKGCDGISPAFRCWRTEAKVGFGIGTALMVAYAINKKKGVGSIVGLGLLGGIGGLFVSSMFKK